MFVPAKDSKDALLVLKNTTGIDGNWKKAWSDADLANMDLLEDDRISRASPLIYPWGLADGRCY